MSHIIGSHTVVKINYTTIPRNDGKCCGNCAETQGEDFGGACYYAGEIGNHYCDMWRGRV